MNMSTRKKLDTLFTDCAVRHYKKGHIFIFSGDSSNYLYNLVSGRIKVYDITYRGDEIVVERFGEQSFFPLSMVINSNNTEYIYEADEDVEVRAIHKDEVMLFLKLNPYVVMDLLSTLYKILDETVSRYILATTKNARSRLIFSIISECKKFGTKYDNGARILIISERELAAASGLSRETVSREIKILKRKKLLTASRNILKIASLQKLEDYLHTYAR